MKSKIQITRKAKRVLFLGDVGRSNISGLLRGLLKYRDLYGANWIIYVNSPDYHVLDLKEITLNNIRKWGIHGILVISDDQAKTTEIASMGLPCVNLSGSQKHLLGTYCLAPDNIKISEIAANYFKDKKFVNFAFCGVESMVWSEERQEAFINAVAKFGHRAHVYQHPRLKGQYSWEKEFAFLVDWLKGLPKPVGLMVASDNCGKQVLEACQAANLKVPEEISVLGNGNEYILCETVHPSLSSVCLNMESNGYQMGEVLDRLINGENLPPQCIWTLPTMVIERQSTDVLAIGDDAVNEAVRFIRFNSTKPMSVTDVAEAVYMTSRTLERRFRKSLGRSVNAEVSRARIERICHMLLETNLSISKIAVKMGFSEPGNLTRAFKREKGIGPQAYRESYTF